MGRPKKQPPATGAAAEAPPQQWPPAAAIYAADQGSPSPFAPPLQQHLQPPNFQPQPQPKPLNQPSQAQFQATPFPPQQPPSYPSFPSQPPQYTPAAHPPSGQQQFKQQSAPVQGTPHVRAPPARYGVWTTGIFGCFENPVNACCSSAMLYLCIAFCCGVPCLVSCSYRTKLRAKYGLPESPAPDCIVHCLCEYCAICQMYRELQNRGLDPSLGWHHNMQRQVRQRQMAQMAPPVYQTMGV